MDNKRVPGLIKKLKSKYPELEKDPDMDDLAEAVGAGDMAVVDAADDNGDAGDNEDTGDPIAPGIVGDSGEGGEETDNSDETASDTTGLFSSFAMKGPPKAPDEKDMNGFGAGKDVSKGKDKKKKPKGNPFAKADKSDY